MSDPVHLELRFPGELAVGASGAGARRVQEYLTLAGHPLVIDGDFGPETSRALATFQAAKGLPPSGQLDALTWAALTAALAGAMAPAERGVDLGETLVSVARRWVGLRELLGNRGPLVRVLCNGQEGPAWAWCAGFVRQVTRQACAAWSVATPAWLSLRVTELARGAQRAEAFIPERDARGTVRAGDLFLVRHAGRWTHTGLVVAAEPGGVRTIEGNTNRGGSRDGDSVRASVRPWAGLDFARVG